MDALAAFCSECASLTSVQLRNADSAKRLRCFSALFVGMTDNVLRVRQGLANNTCNVTNRMTQWTNETVKEAKTLLKKLKEEPRQLNFFEKSCAGFCGSTENDEQNERLDDRLHTLLSRAFVIQIAIYCEEATTAVDLMSGITAQSARQEFLGCVFDLKQRIAASDEISVTVYKQVVFQISEEYQNRQDERTVAGKRAFIRWHKAANDMIKSQLQQKLSEREKSIQTKDEEIKGLMADVSRLREEKKEIEKRAQDHKEASEKKVSAHLDSAKKENEELRALLGKSSEMETSLTNHRQRVDLLETQIKEKEAELQNAKEAKEQTAGEMAALKNQLEALQKSESVAQETCAAQKAELESMQKAQDATTERTTAAEKRAEDQAAQILALQQKLAAAEEAHRANGAVTEQLSVLQQQLKAKEDKVTELQSGVAGLRKENNTLREQVKSKQAEYTTVNQSVSRLVKESETTRTQLAQSEKTIKSSDQELKALRAQLKEKQEKEVALLEHNVELEETCRGLQEQISQKEQEIMDLENRFGDLEDQMKRAIDEKQDSIESLERKIKRLNTSLDNTKKDLQAKKEELDELQR